MDTVNLNHFLWPNIRNATRFRCILPVLFTALLGTGCDRTEEIVRSETASGDGEPAGVSVYAALSPRGTIDESLATYRRLTSYEDNGYVRLSYRLNGQPQTDRAPLSVAWERNGQLGLRVYSVSAGPSQGRWRLRIDGSGSETRGQLLSRAVPAKLGFDWLLSDPLVGQGLAAGLAGFPPQLDLLLAAQPLSGLVNESSQLAFGTQQSIDGRACYTILVSLGRAEYKLYIDQATMLVRRINLPLSNLPQPMLEDSQIEDIQLAIELEGAKGDSVVNWDRFRVEPKSDERLVQHFVPEPTVFETEGLGQRVPGFQLADADGRTVYSSAATHSKRKATVLMWLADHPACRVAAEQFAESAKRVSAQLQGNEVIEFVPIWAEPTPPTGETFQSLVASWGLPGRLALDRTAMGRDLFNVLEAPTLIVLDAGNRLQLRESRANPGLSQILPGLLSRLVRGEDLAATLLEQADASQARYLAELNLASSVEAVGRSKKMPQSYPPVAATVALQNTIDSTSANCASVDSGGNLWLLSDRGRLSKIDLLSARPNADAGVDTPWKPALGSRILVSPAGTHVALVQHDQPTVQIFDVGLRQNRVVDLTQGDTKSDCRPVDVEWLTMNEMKRERLAIITSNSTMVLLDPTNHEQLSGRCPSVPLALVAGLADAETVDGKIVLADQTVQSVQLSMESSHLNGSLIPHDSLLARPASHSARTGDAAASLQSRLAFQPAVGPWSEWSQSNAELVLARGWIAKDEPALFMLDRELNPLWHRRVGLQADGSVPPMQSVAKDPASGMPTWVTAGADQTIYLMRADGLTDHFRVDETFVGLGLIASGQRLLLAIVYPSETKVHALMWR